jgi:hypothetical protein
LKKLKLKLHTKVLKVAKKKTLLNSYCKHTELTTNEFSNIAKFGEIFSWMIGT